MITAAVGSLFFNISFGFMGLLFEIVKPYDSHIAADKLLDKATLAAKFARLQRLQDSRNAGARQTHDNDILS